jgi:hypothetical protein
MQVTTYVVEGVITPQGHVKSESKKTEIVVYRLWVPAYQKKEIDYQDLQTLMDLFDKKTVSEIKPKVLEIYNGHLAIVDKAPIGVCILNLTAFMRDERAKLAPK